jgi:chemotaxis protein methyltransferase CheR
MPVNRADFDYLARLVREQSAIVLEPGKEYLIESRLVPLAKREGFASLESLVQNLRANTFTSTHRKVVEAMTTNETTFFRDVHPFEALKKSLLPEVIKRKKPGQKIGVWSAACSSGQEIYSVIMLLYEHFPSLIPNGVSILATDLSAEMVNRTREGRFSQLEVNRGLPAPMLTRYFEKQGLEWHVKPELRKLVEVREFNLAGSWSAIPPMDIVFMRNVLIYFDVEMKKSILTKVRRSLSPGGYLLLGGAETTLNLDDSFTRAYVNNTTCYQAGS